MKKLILTIGLLAASIGQSQTWTKISGVLDSSQVKGIGVINNQILAAGQNWIINGQTDFAVSNDGGHTWAKLPTWSFASYFPYALPQNNLMMCSGKKLVGNTWQSFPYGMNLAEFSNGAMIGCNSSYPDTVYNVSSTGVKGTKLGNYKFQFNSKYCSASNNRVFVFAYGVGIAYIDYSNPGVLNIPATLDGVAMTQNSWDIKFINNIIKTSNGNLFAIGDGLFKSTDNGVNWTRVQYFQGDLIISIAKTASDELYFIVANKLRKSTDLGLTSTDISGNLTPTGGGFKKDIFVNTTNEVFVLINNNGGINASNSGIFKLTNINSVVDINRKNLAFNVYPVPTTEFLNIELVAEALEATTTITITNILGEEVLKSTETSNKFSVKTNRLKSGVYFVTIGNGGKVATKKIIIN